ncbi:type VII secretion protein EccB [Pseudonocardia broussonetiae]|uniref:Type VII secretion protein EccB n=1 Tax=Pseudonocardia broussonetiae TaxID=2736640 RepID=A0A6M6JIG9_9PSEU|nr:type VII secretion protein EccB [Pseudonocardia broussonetiae]QJY46502.1 type VII secretion protein EccB [Pseudonocardia broussonetiae]
MRTPATRDQADAHRFGVRRLESALVRGDPVPLHEQLRTQRRAAVAGAVLGVLALVGAFVWAKIDPRPGWSAQAVVVGAESGAMYVVAHGPDRLVPVANLPAGRLVLAALRRGGATGADPATAEPVLVADADLDAAPRTPTAAVPGATAVRLGGAVVAPRWAVCDVTDAETGSFRTVVVGGTAPIVGDAAPVLLAVEGGGTWLVVGGRRHRVDPADRAATGALGLDGREPRLASAALVNALPEGVPLRTPRVPDAGASGPDGVGEVGDVLVVAPLGGAAPTFHVLLAGGAQQVPAAVAEALRAAGAVAREVGPDVVARLRPLVALDVVGWPDAVTPPSDAPVVCVMWSDADGTASVVGPALPVPAAAAGVDLAQADGPGERADAVVLVPAGGGAVRATGPGRAPGAGPLWLVAATGVAYGVADEPTAHALGIRAAEPAPEWALRLLPVGGTLDVSAAERTVDVLPG